MYQSGNIKHFFVPFQGVFFTYYSFHEEENSHIFRVRGDLLEAIPGTQVISPSNYIKKEQGFPFQNQLLETSVLILVFVVGLHPQDTTSPKQHVMEMKKLATIDLPASQTQFQICLMNDAHACQSLEVKAIPTQQDAKQSK